VWELSGRSGLDQRCEPAGRLPTDDVAARLI